MVVGLLEGSVFQGQPLGHDLARAPQRRAADLRFDIGGIDHDARIHRDGEPVDAVAACLRIDGDFGNAGHPGWALAFLRCRHRDAEAGVGRQSLGAVARLAGCHAQAIRQSQRAADGGRLVGYPRAFLGPGQRDPQLIHVVIGSRSRWVTGVGYAAIAALAVQHRQAKLQRIAPGRRRHFVHEGLDGEYVVRVGHRAQRARLHRPGGVFMIPCAHPVILHVIPVIAAADGPLVDVALVLFP